MNRRAAAFLLSLSLAAFAHAQDFPGNDIPPSFKAPAGPAADYDKRVVMVPMRDGVKLYTVIVVAKGA